MLGKKFAAALAAVTFAGVFSGCAGKGPSALPSPYDASADYASGLRNTVSWECLYNEKGRRAAVALRNRDAELTVALNGDDQRIAFSAGGEVLARSFGLFALDDGGKLWSSLDGAAFSRMNVYRHGFYYADMHIMNNLLYNGGAELKTLFERTYHTYGDKIHETLTVRNARESFEKLYVSMSAPGKLVSGEGYAAIELASGAMLGYILPSGAEGIIESEENGGEASVRLCSAAPVAAGTREYTFGARLFYGNSRAELETAVREEQNPLSPAVTADSGYAVSASGYDPLRGYYRFDTEGAPGFNEPYYDNPDYRPELDFAFPGGDGRGVYVMLHTGSGCLEAAALMDGAGNALPIPVQSGKNFCGENEEPLYDPGDPAYGESVVPLIAGAEGLEYRLAQIYQNWGKTPIKQLSSIQFFVPYYHLSLGVTETTCFCMNFFTPEVDGYFLPDFRGLSGAMWSGQPQFDSAGHTFLTDYLTGDSARSINYMRYTGSEIASAGPVYTDVTMYFTAQNGDARLSYRAVELPQTDENRAFTTLTLEFLNDVTIENARERLRFMRFDARYSSFRKFGWLSEDGTPAETAAGALSGKTTFPLGSDRPYAAFYDIAPVPEQVANIGLVITASDVTVGGKPFAGGFCVGYDPKSNTGWFSLDADTLEFKKGDRITIGFILMPYGKQITSADPIIKLREDAGDMLFTVTASDGRAEFRLESGVNNVVLRAEGFEDYRLPSITADGAPLELSSGKGYADGYQVYTDENGLYGFAFALDSEKYMGKTIVLEQK